MENFYRHYGEFLLILWRIYGESLLILRSIVNDFVENFYDFMEKFLLILMWLFLLIVMFDFY